MSATEPRWRIYFRRPRPLSRPSRTFSQVHAASPFSPSNIGHSKRPLKARYPDGQSAHPQGSPTEPKPALDQIDGDPPNANGHHRKALGSERQMALLGGFKRDMERLPWASRGEHTTPGALSRSGSGDKVLYTEIESAPYILKEKGHVTESRPLVNGLLAGTATWTLFVNIKGRHLPDSACYRSLRACGILFVSVKQLFRDIHKTTPYGVTT